MVGPGDPHQPSGEVPGEPVEDVPDPRDGKCREAEQGESPCGPLHARAEAHIGCQAVGTEAESFQSAAVRRHIAHDCVPPWIRVLTQDLESRCGKLQPAHLVCSVLRGAAPFFELGCPDRLGAFHQGFVLPTLEVHRDAAHPGLDAVREVPHRLTVVGRPTREIVPVDRSASDDQGRGTENVLPSKHEAHREDREAARDLHRGAQRDTSRAGLQFGEFGFVVRQTFRKNSDRGSVRQRVVHRAEHVLVEIHDIGVVDLAVYGNGTGSSNQPPDGGIGEQWRFGQEPHGASRGRCYQHGVEQRVGMIGDQ